MACSKSFADAVKSFLHAEKPLHILFNDFTDSDNLASIADFLRNVPAEAYVVVVLVGRRADFSVPLMGIDGSKMGKEFPQDVKDAEFRKLTARFPADEDAVREDSRLAYKDAAWRCVHLLTALGLFDRIDSFVVDDRFVPTCEPALSHRAHVLDYLFLRGDLFGRRVGDFITASEYAAKVAEFNASGAHEAPCETRRAFARSIIEPVVKALDNGTFASKVTSYDALCETLKNSFSSATCVLLGPLTGATDVLEMIKAPSVDVYGQLFAFNNLNAKTFNIFLNQFNVDTDQASAQRFLDYVKSAKHVTARFVPTEAIKSNVEQLGLEKKIMVHYGALPPEEQRKRVVMQLWELYTSAKKPGFVINEACVPEPVFDVDVILAMNGVHTWKWVPANVAYKPIREYAELNFAKFSPEYLEGRLGFETTLVSEPENMYVLTENDVAFLTPNVVGRFAYAMLAQIV